MKKSLVLLGMMGVGKTTIAKIVAEKLNLKLVDIDTEIETKNLTYTIFEDYQKILKTHCKKKLFYKTKLFKIPLQSKLTNVIVDELLKKDTTPLPSLEETYDNYKMIIKIFSKHLRKYSKNISGCPIT